MGRLLTGCAAIVSFAAGAFGDVHVVEVRNNEFVPDELTIRPGEKVEWVWIEGTHTVTSGASSADVGAGMLIDHEISTFNRSLSFTFNDPGAFDYFSRPDEGANMSGTIHVETGDICCRDGDVNLDCSITPDDALRAFQAFLLIDTLTICESFHADVNQPATPPNVTPADALCIFERFFEAPSCIDALATDCACSPPDIRITQLPDQGACTNLISCPRIEGVVTGIEPEGLTIATYIKVGNNWFVKPTNASPLTPVDPDGAFDVDFTTGGADFLATEIALFALPEGVAAPPCFGCGAPPEIPEALAFRHIDRGTPLRKIHFAGRNWNVKRSDVVVGPGPNFFLGDDTAIFANGDGLHLNILQAGGTWFSTEAVLDESLGFGTYTFETRSRVDIIDANMIFGAFTYDPSAPEHAFRELDFEYARWGNPLEPTNSQFVVQPCSECPDCTDHCIRYTVNLTDVAQELTHYMVWSEGRVEFRTYAGSHLGTNPPPGDLIQSWVSTIDDVPTAGAENFIFNFWLLNGLAPMSGTGDSVLVTDFAYSETPPDFEEIP